VTLHQVSHLRVVPGFSGPSINVPDNSYPWPLLRALSKPLSADDLDEMDACLTEISDPVHAVTAANPNRLLSAIRELRELRGMPKSVKL
jgi:hypothetical protein